MTGQVNQSTNQPINFFQKLFNILPHFFHQQGSGFDAGPGNVWGKHQSFFMLNMQQWIIRKDRFFGEHVNARSGQ